MITRWLNLIRGFDIREERYRVATALGILAALNLVLYLVLNLPRMHRESLEARRVDAVTQDLSGLSRRVGLMKDLDLRFGTESRKIDTFFNDVLGTKESRMIQIQREVRSIAGSFGLDPETINYQRELLDKVALVRFQINVPLVGDYRNLRQFINKIENSQNFLMIDGVSLGGAKDGGALLDLNIQLSTYFKSSEIAPPPPAKATPGKRT